MSGAFDVDGTLDWRFESEKRESAYAPRDKWRQEAIKMDENEWIFSIFVHTFEEL